MLKQARNVTVLWKSGLEGEGDASARLSQAACCGLTLPWSWPVNGTRHHVPLLSL